MSVPIICLNSEKFDTLSVPTIDDLFGNMQF